MSFNCVQIEGNIFTDDILQRIAKSDMPNQSSEDYGVDNLREEIQSTWADVRTQYKIYQGRKEKVGDGGTGVSETRNFWIAPLLHMLGYKLKLSNADVVNEKSYAISHRDEQLDGYPLLIRGFNELLDRKPDSGLRISPHALVQDYLNVKEEYLYGIVTNGDELRLLRDSSLMTRLSYVSFDLVQMLEENHFSDFQLMFKLLHASRMPQDTKDPASSIIENYHEESLESGSRIRDKLSKAVEQCIRIMGTGFLQDRSNTNLWEWAKENPENAKEYYDWLLKLIYRILFLLVIEERDLVFPNSYKQDDQLREKHKIYYSHYAIHRLRNLAEKRRYASDRYFDLWEQLRATFRLYGVGNLGKPLGIAPLAGDLFTSRAIGKINECRINNKILLECIRLLNQFEDDRGQRVRVNYASLDVEELGSVYEGLLEFEPVIDSTTRSFTFIEGTGRSISGSHYTPDELVQPLIKHSLEHLIIERTVALDADTEQKHEAIQKILSLSICDVSCGSGHILLAAARRVGLEVARLRSGEQQPNPLTTRFATRDAIRQCIYGVDKNPLAVTLCKVALWLEAHTPGEPLNFLDHKIKCGDAIVGLARIEELEDGIATEAFKATGADDKELCKLLRKSNKADRNARESGQLSTSEMIGSAASKLKIYREKFHAFQKLPESTVDDIADKKKAYINLTTGEDWWFVYNLANLKIAQYFVHKSDQKNVVTDSEYFDIMSSKKTQTYAESLALAEASRRKFFHWFLEFPDVFTNSGFDCVLGNPPYLGDKKLRRAFGKLYLNYLVNFGQPKGAFDLVTYFLRRAYSILNPQGFLTIITTNTISQGDSRIGGLKPIRQSGGIINFARPSIKWPGKASVYVTIIGITKRNNVPVIFNSNHCSVINSFLIPNSKIDNIYNLKSNNDISFVGNYILGSGFIISHEKAASLVEVSSENRDVIDEYLNGDDLNSSPRQKASRCVINFYDWPEDQARKYKKAFNIIEKHVKPERIKKSDTRAREKWWQHARPRLNGYKKIKGYSNVIVVARTSKSLAFARVKRQTFSDAIVVFTNNTYGFFAICQSSIHECWTWTFCTTMKTDLVYTPTRTIETFPFPINYANTEDIGRRLYNKRASFMIDIDMGLTNLYTQFHNKQVNDILKRLTSELSEKELKLRLSRKTHDLYRQLKKSSNTMSLDQAVEQIMELRYFHELLDYNVLASYGWNIDNARWGSKIDLRHDFYEVDYLPENDNIRYTIHPEARKELLKRLLMLNHEYHEAEDRGITYEELNEEKIITLLQAKVKAWLPEVKKLEHRSLKFLCAGEDLLPSLHNSTIKSYNSFVIQYGSAIEFELQYKIFVPFNNWFQKQFDTRAEKKTYLISQIEADPKNLIGKFCKMLLKNKVKYTMGDMQFILNLVQKETGSSLQACPLLQIFREFALDVYSDAIINKEFLTRLKSFIDNYRNEAAHTGMVTREQAMACRDEVREIIQILIEREVD